MRRARGGRGGGGGGGGGAGGEAACGGVDMKLVAQDVKRKVEVRSLSSSVTSTLPLPAWT